jgi:hypothetical protein
MIRFTEITISHWISDHFQSWMYLMWSKMCGSVYHTLYFDVRAFELMQKSLWVELCAKTIIKIISRSRSIHGWAIFIPIYQFDFWDSLPGIHWDPRLPWIPSLGHCCDALPWLGIQTGFLGSISSQTPVWDSLPGIPSPLGRDPRLIPIYQFDSIPDSFRFTSLTPTSWILGPQTPVDVESGIHYTLRRIYEICVETVYSLYTSNRIYNFYINRIFSVNAIKRIYDTIFKQHIFNI